MGQNSVQESDSLGAEAVIQSGSPWKDATEPSTGAKWQIGVGRGGRYRPQCFKPCGFCGSWKCPEQRVEACQWCVQLSALSSVASCDWRFPIPKPESDAVAQETLYGASEECAEDRLGGCLSSSGDRENAGAAGLSWPGSRCWLTRWGLPWCEHQGMSCGAHQSLHWSQFWLKDVLKSTIISFVLPTFRDRLSFWNQTVSWSTSSVYDVLSLSVMRLTTVVSSSNKTMWFELIWHMIPLVATTGCVYC